MADKLTYKGGKDVVNASGTMKLVLPKGGGDFHRVPTWWSKKGTVKYTESAIFKVPLDNGQEVRLILPGVTAHMTVEIRHDGAGEFTFPNSGNLERAVVVGADSLDIIVEYQFAKISGGAVLKRTVGTLPAPAAAPAEAPAAPAEPPIATGPDFSYTVTVDNGVYELNGLTTPGLAFSVGDVVEFDYSGVTSHPVGIFTDSSKTTPVTAGVVDANNKLTWTIESAGSYSYQCIIHAAMGGDITVT